MRRHKCVKEAQDTQVVKLYCAESYQAMCKEETKNVKPMIDYIKKYFRVEEDEVTYQKLIDVYK